MSNYFRDQVTQSDIREAKRKAREELATVVWFGCLTLCGVGLFALIHTVFGSVL